MDSLERFVSGLKGVIRISADSYKAYCPAHKDDVQSLSVRRGSRGRVLWKCHAGCSQDAVLSAHPLGLTWVDVGPQGGKSRVSASRPPVNLTEQGAELRNDVYLCIGAMTRLCDSDRIKLLARGLSDDCIVRGLYRSLLRGALRIEEVEGRLYQSHGHELAEVPGFVLSGAGNSYHFVAPEGIFIPIRDYEGQIVSAQVRTEERPKYRTLLGGGKLAHYSLFGRSDREQFHPVCLTEGPLKADVAAHLANLPCIGVPGVTAWQTAIPLLERIRPSEVILAFDADWGRKPQVRNQLVDCTKGLQQAGYKTALYLWKEEDGKGIDDLLLAGRVPVLGGLADISTT